MLTTLPESPAEDPPVIAPAKRKQSSPVLAICLYLTVVFIGAALIAPRFFATAQFLESLSHRFSGIADQPFHRYVNRCMILLAIVGLPPFFKALGIRSAAMLGLRWTLRRGVELVQGFGWGFVILALAATLFVACGGRVLDLDHDGARWFRHFKNAGLAALLVGVLEELLFRGALFGSLRRSQSFWQAALCSSALYALLHFLERPGNPGRVEWHSGLLVLGQMLHGFTEWQTLIPAFLNLTILGVLLALVFERTGAIYYSIGLHAGLVFFVKTFALITNPASPEPNRFWGSDKLVDGWAAGVLLLLVFLFIERILPPRKEPMP